MHAAVCVKLGTFWIFLHFGFIIGESDGEEAWGAARLREKSRQTDAETRLEQLCTASPCWCYDSYWHSRTHITFRVPTHPWKSLKVLEFFPAKFKAVKVLENRTGAWRYLNFISQVLESPWIHQVKLCDISNFVKQHLCMFSGSFSFWFCETCILAYFMLSCFLSTTRSFSLPGILPNTKFANNCHVVFLST